MGQGEETSKESETGGGEFGECVVERFVSGGEGVLTVCNAW
jgi:hypothetical protein